MSVDTDNKCNKSKINAIGFIKREISFDTKTRTEIIRIYNNLRANYLTLILENASLKRRISLLENKKFNKYEKDDYIRRKTK